MDYDVVASKERLTGRAYFNPQIVGGLGITSSPWLDLGNIQLMSLDYGIKRKEHYKARRGMLITDRYDAYSATPKWEITGDEFVSATLFLIFLGTDVANTVQSAATGVLISTGVRVHIGGVYDVGKYALYNVTVGSGKTPGVDYVVDPGPGKIYWPQTTTYNEDDPSSVTYSCPQIIFDKILPPMSNLNRTGLMQLFEEDDSPPISPSANSGPKTVHTFPVSLSTDSGGQTKVDDYKAFKMIATVTDPTAWVILKRFT